MDVGYAMRGDDVEMFILPLTQVRINNHGPVVTRVQPALVVAVRQQGVYDPIELPGRRRGRRKEKVPGDIDFQSRFGFLGDSLLVFGQMKQPMIITADCFRTCPQDRHFRMRHVCPSLVLCLYALNYPRLTMARSGRALPRRPFLCEDDRGRR